MAGLALLLAAISVTLALWACWLAWQGRWKPMAICLAIPLGTSALIAALAVSGALNAGHSEDWGPLMALLAATGIAGTTIIAALIAGFIGYLGHRTRKGTRNGLNEHPR